jgi:hypothetical protein
MFDPCFIELMYERAAEMSSSSQICNNTIRNEHKRITTGLSSWMRIIPLLPSPKQWMTYQVDRIVQHDTFWYSELPYDPIQPSQKQIFDRRISDR